MATRSPSATSRVASLERALFVVDREHLAALLTHVDAVVLTFDADGVITFVSNSVRELLGFEPCELIGRCAFDFVHADDATRLDRQPGSMGRTRRRGQGGGRARPDVVG